MGKAVYKNALSQRLVLDLYDKQVSALKIDFEDIYVDTRFGITHLLKTGNPNGKPILLFHRREHHFSILFKRFQFSFRNNYLIYAADTMGHPGKSAQTVLSQRT